MDDVRFDLSGKRYVVIGASSGIGYQAALEIRRSSADVLAIARNKDRLDKLNDDLQGSIVTRSVDVRDKAALEKVIIEYTGEYGKINGSVYTAGISKTTALRSFSEEDARDVMDTNYWGWINLMSVICKKKYSEEGSSHVVISSVAAHTGEAGNFAYGASKAALITDVKTFAKELAGRKCRVNSISPGFVQTALTEGYFEERGFSEGTKEKHLLGLGKPEDVSGMILYLLSDRARWITGTDIIIDGGYTVSD